MHVFLKPALIIFVVIFVFFFILIKSNTIETTTTISTTRSGMPQQITNYTYHWDRFGDYIKNTPARIKKSFSGSN